MTITNNFPLAGMGYDALVDLLHVEQQFETDMQRALLEMVPGSSDGKLLYERLRNQEIRVNDVGAAVRRHPDRHPEGRNKNRCMHGRLHDDVCERCHSE